MSFYAPLDNPIDAGPINVITREFSPAEFAKITGVHTALQRDWRRRGLLPERESDGWTQFLLSTVIQGAILFHLADAGFSPKQMLIVASTGLPNIYSRLQTLKAAMSFGGIAEREKPKVWLDDMFLFSSVPYRFLVIRHLPGARSMSVDEFQDTVVKCKDFDALREIIEAGGSNTVIDLHNLADQIAERAGLPLFRIEIVDCPENEELLKSVRDKTEDGVNLDAVRELFSDARAALREKGLL